MSEQTEMIEPLLVSIKETQRLLGGISRRTIYLMASDGEIEFVKVRGRSFVRISQIRELAGEAA